VNHSGRPRGLRIEHLTSAEIAEAIAAGARTAILPLGAIEQHGPHLPLSVDSDHADALALRIAERLGAALVLPTVRVGYSPHHLGFSGTLSVRPSTLEAICLDYCSSLAAHGFTRVVLFSGHIGNYPIMRDFEPRLAAALAPALQVIVYGNSAAILDAWRKSALGDPTGCSKAIGHAALDAVTDLVVDYATAHGA
jgi:creatinine amidohydrolase